MSPYFSEREFGAPARTVDTIGERAWGGIFALIQTRLGDGSFGYRFPLECQDAGKGAYAVDQHAFQLMLAAEVPDVSWPLSSWDAPSTPAILDLLEFAAAAVGLPVKGRYHSYADHHHLTWDREAGLAAFVDQANVIFARNGLAYELTPEGLARRVLPESLSQPLAAALFATGDNETDRLLERARSLISSPKPEDRQDALEKLWDAFERLKTLEPGADKKMQADALLDRAANPGSRLRRSLADEARVLTSIGNDFRIRHAETSKEPLANTDAVDYLFTRMLAFVRFVLKTTGRGG
jgi:hypothetical protein